MLFEILKYLGKSSVTHILLAEEQTTKKIKIYKTLIKLRFVEINPLEQSTGTQFTKLNSCKMLKKCLTKISLLKVICIIHIFKNSL